MEPKPAHRGAAADEGCRRPKALAGSEQEYQILVTNLTLEALSLADLHRQSVDSENAYDELKNQWGWGGFMPKDLLRCQVAARDVALVCNWWKLFGRAPIRCGGGRPSRAGHFS